MLDFQLVAYIFTNFYIQYVYMYIYLYKYTCICAYVYICIHMYINLHLYVHMYTYIFVYQYTYVCMYREVPSKPEIKHPRMTASRDRASSQAETREETRPRTRSAVATNKIWLARQGRSRCVSQGDSCLAAALSRVVRGVVPIPAVAAASMQHFFVRWILNKHS